MKNRYIPGGDEIFMKEQPVFFQCGDVTIEGLYAPGEGSRGVVVTHPHSQMGGNMMNNVG